MKKDREQEMLFGNEKRVLDTAKVNLTLADFQSSFSFDAYRSLTRHYEKLLRQTTKLLKISDSQHRLLQKVQNDIRNLLDNAGQGFLTFGSNLLVDREYSSECVRIFGHKIEGLNIIELLVPDDKELQELLIEVFHNIYNSDGGIEVSSELSRLPAVIEVAGQHIRVEYRVITQTIEKQPAKIIMLVLTDITEKKAAQDQVEYLNCHDSLTGLYNRAYIDTIIPELDREEDIPLSMIMADVNGLKLTNDVFGHQAGDQLLRNLADVLAGCLRGRDVVARWGGDEFLIILPGTDETVVNSISDRIKASCRNAQTEPIPLSVAMGTATRNSIKESMFDLFGRAEDLMYSNKLKESQSVRRQIIAGLEKNLQLRSFESQEHIKRVKGLALTMAEALSLSEQEKKEIELLALLHDIGIVAIPESILLKPGSLHPEEWKIIQKHSEIGFRMAQSIGEFKVAESILASHERWDGGGYPRNLTGNNIPLSSRIIALVESFDVMTRERPYRKAMSIYDAQQELGRCAGSQFDPELVKVFLNIDK